MKRVGIDIGTGKLCAVLEEDGRVLREVSVPNSCAVCGRDFESLQDADSIVTACETLLEEVCSGTEAEAIGISTQMHGVLYLDAAGRAVSPLFTWQDGRGNLPFEGGTYATRLSALTGYSVYSGYGLVTHFVNLQRGEVPEGACKLVTAGDYLAARLCGLASVPMSATNAASLGVFDVGTNQFDKAALTRAGIDVSILPEVKDGVLCKIAGTSICVPIGDNQASFLGAAGFCDGAVLVNLGTGGQTSVCTAVPLVQEGWELRPFLDKYLLCKSVLCGGRALSLLEEFFASVLELCDVPAQTKLFDKIAKIFENGVYDTDLVAKTSFDGERGVLTRAELTNLTSKNFRAEDLSRAVASGLVESLFADVTLLGVSSPVLFGSGNGLRKNPWLVRLFEKRFQLPMNLCEAREEAALGAALCTEIYV